jgi:membrane protease YdiL (CAAX protease family)
MDGTSSAISSAPSRPSSRERWALVAWLALTGVLVATAFASQAAGSSDSDSNGQLFFDYDFAIGSAIVYGVFVLLTWLIARLLPDPPVDLGFVRTTRRWLWLGLAVAVGGIVFAAALEPLLHAGEDQGLTPTEWESGRAAAFVLSCVTVVLVAPFAEELLYRGLGVRVLAFAGAPTAVLVTALVFAASHGLVAALLPLGLFAIGLGWLRWSSQSIWPSFAAHAGYNLIGVIAAIVSLL